MKWVVDQQLLTMTLWCQLTNSGQGRLPVEKVNRSNVLNGYLAKVNRLLEVLIQLVFDGLANHSAGKGVGLLLASSATMTNKALVTLSICGDR